MEPAHLINNTPLDNQPIYLPTENKSINWLAMPSSLNDQDIAKAFADAPLALKDGRTDKEKEASKKFLLQTYDYYSMLLFSS